MNQNIQKILLRVSAVILIFVTGANSELFVSPIEIVVSALFEYAWALVSIVLILFGVLIFKPKSFKKGLKMAGWVVSQYETLLLKSTVLALILFWLIKLYLGT